MTKSHSLTKQHVFLRGLIEAYHEEPEKYFELIEEKKREEILSLDLLFLKKEDFVHPFQSFFSSIHPTWIRSSLKELPEALAHEALQRIDPSKPKSILNHYFQAKVAKQLEINALLPKALLLKMPLGSLLELSWESLLFLIGRLGLRDLGQAMRREIDPQVLNRTKEALSSTDWIALEKVMLEQDLYPPEQKPLSQWGSTPREVNKNCQEMGLKRLGRALSKSDPSLIWTTAHKFDEGRGLFILKHSKETLSQELCDRLILQVLKLIEPAKTLAPKKL